MHYDAGDKGPSRGVWFWGDDGVGVRCGAWFLLPNHGIAVELGSCTIRWRGDLILHGTHQTKAGKECANTLLSVWNGVGGKLLRSRLDALAFQSDECGRKFWPRVPSGIPVVTRMRAASSKPEKGERAAPGRWTHGYGVTSASPCAARTGKNVLMQGAAGERETGNHYVKVVTAKSIKKTTKWVAVSYRDIRVRWSALDPDQVAALIGAVDKNVPELIAQSAERELGCIKRERSGITAACAKRTRNKKRKKMQDWQAQPKHPRQHKD